MRIEKLAWALASGPDSPRSSATLQSHATDEVTKTQNPAQTPKFLQLIMRQSWNSSRRSHLNRKEEES